MDSNHVIELFIGRSMIDQSLAEDMLQEMESSGKDVGEILSDFQVVGHKDDIWPIIASELGAEMVDISEYTPPDELLQLVPSGMARLHGALPVNYTEDGLTVVLVDPLNPQTAEDLRFALGKEVIVAIAPDHLVEQRLSDCYGGEGQAMEELLGQLEGGPGQMSDQELEQEANSAPIVRYVDLVMFQAIKERASDIHFEPFEKEFKIRYRVDGSLYEMAPPPAHLALPIISRV